jgi:hypothetical protein
MIPNVFLQDAHALPVGAITKNLPLQLRTHDTFAYLRQIARAVFGAGINAV